MKHLSPRKYYDISRDNEYASSFSVANLFPSIINGQNTFYRKDTERLEKKPVLYTSKPGYGLFCVSTWWFDGKPFAVECKSGRTAQVDIAITNGDLYRGAESHINSLLSGNLDVVDENEPLASISDLNGVHIRQLLVLDDEGNLVRNEPLFGMKEEIEFTLYSVAGHRGRADLVGTVVRLPEQGTTDQIYQVQIKGLARNQKKMSLVEQNNIENWIQLRIGTDLMIDGSQIRKKETTQPE